MRYPVVAKTIFSGSLQNTKNSFKIIEADAGLFFCRIIFQSESLLVHQSIYSNNIYNNIVEKP